MAPPSTKGSLKENHRCPEADASDCRPLKSSTVESDVKAPNATE
jgi:hypothetical protein